MWIEAKWQNTKRLEEMLREEGYDEVILIDTNLIINGQIVACMPEEDTLSFVHSRLSDTEKGLGKKIIWHLKS